MGPLADTMMQLFGLSLAFDVLVFRNLCESEHVVTRKIGACDKFICKSSCLSLEFVFVSLSQNVCVCSICRSA